MHSMASIDATSQRNRLKRLFDEDRELDRKIESLQKERHRLSIEANQSGKIQAIKCYFNYAKLVYFNVFLMSFKSLEHARPLTQWIFRTARG